MRARIDISEVEATTKIRAKYLRALENEEWDLLPGPRYVKSFLRTYADFLGPRRRAAGRGVQARYERPPRPGAAADRAARRARASARPRAAPGCAAVARRRAWLRRRGRRSRSTARHRGSGQQKRRRRRAAGSATTTRQHRRHGARHRAAPPSAAADARHAAARAHRPRLRLPGRRNGKKPHPRPDLPPAQRPGRTAPSVPLTLGNAAVQMRVNGKTLRWPPPRARSAT